MTTDRSPELFTCGVCSEPLEARMSAECNWCDSRYHLNQRNDVVAKDCGEVWIDEQYLALQFACNTCLTGPAAESRPAKPAANATARSRSTAARARRYRRRA
jgi:hypothetical protein